MKVTARTTETGPDGKKVTKASATVELLIPADLNGKIEKFSAEMVNNAAEDAIVIAAQSVMRRLLEKGKSQDEIQAEMDTWRPDTRAVTRQTAFEKAQTALTKMSPEERAKLIAQLQELPTE